MTQLGDIERVMKKQGEIHPTLRVLLGYQESIWGDMMEDLEWASQMDGVYLGSGEGNLYLETRKPYVQTADYATVTQTTTSKNWLPQRGTGFMNSEGYWDLGKEWRFTLFGKMTTGAAAGNQTTELRYQNAVPLTDAGGTILATSSAVAAANAKTSISWLIMGRVHSRAIIGTAAAMFGWCMFISNQLSVLLPAANIPQLIPESAGASTNVDTTLAGGISIQGKNSGANGSTVNVHDLSVESCT